MTESVGEKKGTASTRQSVIAESFEINSKQCIFEFRYKRLPKTVCAIIPTAVLTLTTFGQL